MPNEAKKVRLDRPPVPRRSVVARTFRILFWVVVGSLVGLNARWAWDSRPLADLKTISVWIDQGRLDEARAVLARHLRLSPHHGEARFLLAKVLVAGKDLKGSVEQWRLVPYWSTRKPEALALEGQYALKLDRARDAEAAWRACIDYDPRVAPADYAKFYHDVNLELIQLYRVEGRLDEARAATWKVYERTTPANHPAILDIRLKTELRPVPAEKAAEKLRRYVAASPDDWQAARALARAEQTIGHPAEASRLIRACLNARPDDPDVLRDWAAILQAQGDRKGLEAALARLPADDRDPATWKYRGIAREWAGDLAGAVAADLQATRLDPSDPDSWERLARVEQRLGRAEDAERHRVRSREVREARAELPRAYSDYLRASRRAGDDPTSALTRLASLCAKLGWKRDSDAWSSLIPRT